MKIIVKTFSYLIIIFIFYILIKNLYIKIDELSQYGLKFIYFKFIIAIICKLVSYLFVPKMWSLILEGLDVTLPYKKAFEIQYISHLARYLPGKVWAQIAQIYLAKKENIPIKTTFISNVLCLIITSLVSVYVFLISFLFWENICLAMRLFSLLFAVVLGYTLLKKVRLLEIVVNFIMRKFFNKDLYITIKYKNIILLLVLAGYSWVIFGIAYFFMVNSFFSINIKECIIIVGIYAISWLVGCYALIFPGGLGISEGVQVYLLNYFFPLSISIIIALACRIWMSLAECLISLLALVSRALTNEETNS